MIKTLDFEDVIKKNNLPKEEFKVRIFCCQCEKEQLCNVFERYDGHAPHRGRVIHCKECKAQGGCDFVETSIVFPFERYRVLLAVAFEDDQYKLSLYKIDSIYPDKLGGYPSVNQLNEAIKNFIIIK